MAFDTKILYNWHKFAEKNGGEIAMQNPESSENTDECVIRFDYQDFPIAIVFAQGKSKTYTKIVSAFADVSKVKIEIYKNDFLIKLAGIFNRNSKTANGHRIFSKDKDYSEFLKKHFAFNRLTTKYPPLELITIQEPNKKDGYFPFENWISDHNFLYLFQANKLISSIEQLELLLVMIFDLQMLIEKKRTEA